jgi:D-alanyl-D-alanine dipeptidase
VQHYPHIPICDNKEPLEILDETEFVLEPAYFNMGVSDTKIIQLRSGAIERLREAKKNLQKISGCEGWNFKIWDGFRPIKVQNQLCINLKKDLKAKYPNWSEEELQKGVMEFLSPPSTDLSAPAPHNTGGVVDLTLVDADGNEIPMGTDFDDFTEKSYTDYFSKAGSKEKMANIYHENRILFKKIMESVGFINDTCEWWHFAYGTQAWAAAINEKHAIYGSAEF